MKTTSYIITAFAFMILEHKADSITCPIGWTHRAHSCYNFSMDKKSFDEARDTCHQLGAYMVKVGDDDTNHFLFRRKEHITGSWLGLQKHNYLWSDGSSVQWLPNELPLNSTGNAHCVYFVGKVGIWGAADCSVLLPYICEKEAEECDWSWKYHKGRCYLISVLIDKSTFGGMWKQCKLFGARPVKIESEETLIFLTQNSAREFGYWFWIGMSTLQWDDGSVYDWYKDLGPRQHHECVKLSGADGTWQYVNCSEENFYICEKGSADSVNETHIPNVNNTYTVRRETTIRSLSTSTLTLSHVGEPYPESYFKATVIITTVYPVVILVLAYFVYRICRSNGCKRKRFKCNIQCCTAPLYDDVLPQNPYERLPPFYVNVQQ